MAPAWRLGHGGWLLLSLLALVKQFQGGWFFGFFILGVRELHSQHHLDQPLAQTPTESSSKPNADLIFSKTAPTERP